MEAGAATHNLYNSRGDVISQTNAAGVATFQAQYEAFGTRRVEAGLAVGRQKANTKDEDPTGLLNEGFRYRDLETGSFITRDPMGLVDGPNVYTYVQQNPWSKFDPDGLWSWSAFGKGLVTGIVVAAAITAVVVAAPAVLAASAVALGASAATAAVVSASAATTIALAGTAATVYSAPTIAAEVATIASGDEYKASWTGGFENNGTLSDEAYSEKVGNVIGGLAGGALGMKAGTAVSTSAKAYVAETVAARAAATEGAAASQSLATRNTGGTDTYEVRLNGTRGPSNGEKWGRQNTVGSTPGKDRATGKKVIDHSSSETTGVLLVGPGQDHQIVVKVGPDAEAVSDGIGLWLRHGVAGDGAPQPGFTLIRLDTGGSPVALAVPADGKITLAAGSEPYQQLTSPAGLTLFLKRDTTVDEAHSLSVELLKKREWYPEPSKRTVALTLLPVDLDVNGDGDLDDSCDGLATYLPGYLGNQAILHTGASFKDVRFDKPQAMKLILAGLGTAAVDSATFKILNPTSYFGYCGNAIAEKPKDKAINYEAINSGADFSFADGEADLEIQGTIEADQIWAPIYCKDYGAWCQVEITLKKNGTVIGTPTLLTLPLDTNGDQLTDGWQDAENLNWNAQFNPATPRQTTAADRALVNPDLDNEEADPDGNNGDGGRDLPAMATTGDGLKIREEYRGFILDGGPGITTPGQHQRLGIARKEMLVECSVEAGLTTAAKNGTGTNQTTLDGFTLAGTMGAVSALYRDPDRGAAIDLYWAEDVMKPGDPVDYKEYTNVDDNFHDRNAWEWNGAIDYSKTTYDANGYQTGFLKVGVSGAGVPVWDMALFKIDGPKHSEYYDSRPVGTRPHVSVLQAVNRNPNLEAFAKLLLPTRRGKLQGGMTAGQIDPSVLRVLKDEIDHSIGNDDGAKIDVASLCDEGIAMWWRETGSQHFTSDQFAPLLKMDLCHELGHLIHPAHFRDDAARGTVMNGRYFHQDHSMVDWSSFQWDVDEVKGIRLPARSIYRQLP